ncbi:MAG: amino acid adenylation domain-containing protein, partial [Oscillospiraceae bacterium]|nr:amino acid adenylation domain-containing protein [Oscillospiraceae bacterium]
SNQLANLLIKKGISLEEKIGIITTHSIETVIAILGVLKAGGAYVPIDLNYPNERIEYIIEDSTINILLTNVSVDFLDFKGEIINLLDGDFYNEPTSSVGRKSCPNNLAYIIYTSGSTGNPKAVMVEHKGLSNYIYWAKTKYVKDENDVFALYSSLSFDLTVTSIFTPLISGCEIAIYRDDDESEYVLYKILREQKATIVKLTPSHLLLLQGLDNRNSSIRVFIVGGENLKVSVAKNVYDSFSKDLEIYNEYGPTETVVGCMIYKFDPIKDKTGSVPIGVPINNTQIYVLNNDLQPMPLGYTGEMYIGGIGVARGYANRLELTNERFIDNPFVPGTKMYKTGDLAKFLKFDEIEYIGRADSQVKINGFRIELGEIEKAISGYENIKDVVITVVDNQNSKALCAYFEENKKVDILDLKNYLASVLPEYMIPLHFIKMDQFPFTNNGKVNKKLLPKPE